MQQEMASCFQQPPPPFIQLGACLCSSSGEMSCGLSSSLANLHCASFSQPYASVNQVVEAIPPHPHWPTAAAPLLFLLQLAIRPVVPPATSATSQHSSTPSSAVPRTHPQPSPESLKLALPYRLSWGSHHI